MPFLQSAPLLTLFTYEASGESTFMKIDYRTKEPKCCYGFRELSRSVFNTPCPA